MLKAPFKYMVSLAMLLMSLTGGLGAHSIDNTVIHISKHHGDLLDNSGLATVQYHETLIHSTDIAGILHTFTNEISEITEEEDEIIQSRKYVENSNLYTSIKNSKQHSDNTHSLNFYQDFSHYHALNTLYLVFGVFRI